MKKQSLIKGSLILGIAGMLTRFLGIFFRWPLFMLIGDEGVGYYQMVYPLYMFFIAMASGIPIAMSKMISESNAINDIKTSFQVVKESAILTIFIGTGTSLILFLFSKQIINFLDKLGQQDLTLSEESGYIQFLNSIDYEITEDPQTIYKIEVRTTTKKAQKEIYNLINNM